MKRISITPRENYIKKLEELFFDFHSIDGIYWDESAYYEFNISQVEEIESVTNKLFEMCLTAVQHVIDNKLYDKLHIDPLLIPYATRSSVSRGGFGHSTASHSSSGGRSSAS